MVPRIDYTFRLFMEAKGFLFLGIQYDSNSTLWENRQKNPQILILSIDKLEKTHVIVTIIGKKLVFVGISKKNLIE